MANDLFYFMRRNHVDLLRYLPPFLARDSSFAEVQNLLSREHESLRVRVADLARQNFIDTANYSMADWEEFVGVKKISDDLEARRARVKAKLRGAEVMTVANTNELVRMFTDGKNSYVDEYFRPNEIKIVIPVPDHLLYLPELGEALVEFMPAHLSLTVEIRRAFFNKLKAGTAYVTTGTVESYLATPKPKTLATIRVGQIFRRSGEIIIHADMDDFAKLTRIYESAIAELLITDIGIARPSELTATTTTNRVDHKATVRLGQVFVRQGQIVIKPSATQIPEQPTDRVNHKATVRVGQVFARQGQIVIKPSATQIPEQPTDRVNHKAIVRLGQVFVRQGQIVIKPSDTQIPLDFDVPADGDWLRLYFNFATGKDKPVLLSNPREDLTKGDIYDLGEFAQDKVVFKNERAEGTLGIDHVDLIRGYALSDGDDLQTLPAADKLRLFFAFPDGNAHKILLKGIREGITVGELKALSEVAEANQLILNAYNQSTTGLTNVALIKNYRVSTGDLSAPISF